MPEQIYYYPDGQGSTSYIANGSSLLLEKYTYDLSGKPTITTFGSTGPYNVDMLFTGQKWYTGYGILDLRNRAYNADLGRFLQPDPIGFAGDPANFYRYCANNPVNRSDPSGLEGVQKRPLEAQTDLATDGSEPYYSVPDYDPNGVPQNAGPGLGTPINDTPNDRSPSGYTWDHGFDRSLAPGNYGPSDHGSSGTRGDSGGGISGRSAGSYWGPVIDRRATPQERAWTNTGRTPTLIATAVIFAPLAVPEALAPLLVAASNVAVTGANAAASVVAYQIYLNPLVVFVAGTAANQFISPNAGTVPGVFQTTIPGIYAEWAGWGLNQWINDNTDNSFGP